jgi:methionyl-tRNA formyltransferase
MRVVFFGTSDFAARILSFMLEQKIEIVAVVTRPDRPKGRSLTLSPPPVKEIALQAALPIFQPEKASTDLFAEELKTLKGDLFFVVAYGEILKKNILSIPPLGCINVHASLLPHYRGAAPMQRALMDGVKQSGITIIDMVLQMDAGDMIAREAIDVPESMTWDELDTALCSLACRMIPQVLSDFERGVVVRLPQDPTHVTFAPKISPEETQIDWNREAEKIHNQIRALSPQPGAWCWIAVSGEKKRLKIKRSRLVHGRTGTPGLFLSTGKEGWVVGCGSGALELLEVQMEGKKTLDAVQFFNGLRPPFLLS